MSKQKNNFIYQQIVWLKYVFCHCLKDLINFHLSIVKSVIITNCNIPKMKMLHFHFQLFVFYQVKNTLNNTFCWKDNTYDIKWMNCHISSFFFLFHQNANIKSCIACVTYQYLLIHTALQHNILGAIIDFLFH